MRLAIHQGRGDYSKRWLEYCRENNIDAKAVDCCSSDIIAQLADVDGLLWHWSHRFHVHQLMARDVLQAAQTRGIKVFPDSHTCWHFDDKIAQKYLLEAIGAPLAKTQVFYTLESAMEWIDTAAFPQVFKLRRGAGSTNVQIVPDARSARKLARVMFGGGFRLLGKPFQKSRPGSPTPSTRWQRRNPLKRLSAAVANIRKYDLDIGRERGYLYMQEFLPGNTFDTRVAVIGARAFAFTRNVRPNDFRASGSGSLDYDHGRINPKCIQIAFDVAAKLQCQSIAYDFVNDLQGNPVILEISYGYMAKAVYDCGGYWDRDLTWHDGAVSGPEDAILVDLVNSIRAGTVASF